MGLFSRTLSRLDELKRALTKDPASRQFLALADEHRRQGQVAEAISVLEKGLAQDPTSVAGHVALGRLFQQSGRGEDAIASFQTALRLDPQNLVALRQAADLYLGKGDKVEAIKRLKLFRGLSPGDREVNELIRQLDEELASTAAPRPATRFPTGTVPVFATEAPAYPPPVPPMPFATAEIAVPPEPTHEGMGTTAEAAVSPFPTPEGSVAAFSEGAAEPAAAPESFEDAEPIDVRDAPVAPPAAATTLADASFEALAGPPASPAPEPLAPPPIGSRAAHAASAGSPAPTETLAALLRAQGHLGEAEGAYRDLAGRESDPARAARFSALADEIAAARVGTPRGRLEAWVVPFTRALGRRESDLVATVEEAVRRIGPSSALVTDLEGVPVVSVGPRSDADAMESLAAELTAFWKNVRRSRSEIGEGALDGLVLSCSAGTAVVRAITPSYALLVKAGAGIPAGRLRYEAARAAEQLRPALV